MAATSFWPIHGRLRDLIEYAENPEKTVCPDASIEVEQGFFDVLEYVQDDTKTDYRQFVTGINCTPETAVEQMTMTKLRYGKTGGTVAFHAYQSFKGHEASPELAHRIGVETARRMWGDQFEVIVATHLNTNSVHNHFVVNSVSFVDGKRLNDNKALKRNLRAVSDELCGENGLSVIERHSPTRTPRKVWFEEREGLDTRYNIMRHDIDDAISRSMTMQFFFGELRKMGYIVNYDNNRKYATIQMPGVGHPTRFKTLGENYSEEAIKQRIMEAWHAQYPYRPPERIKPFNFGIRSLRGLFLHYCYLLNVIERNNRHPYYSASLREDLKRLDAYSAQVRLLCKNEIDTSEQLEQFIKDTQAAITEQVKERSRVYSKIAHCKDESLLPDLLKYRDSLTESITLLRKELKNAKAVMERSEAIAEKLRTAETLETTKQKEHNRYGR